LLLNGKVLVAGGFGAGGNLASAELFDPASGTWSGTGSMNSPRQYHTAIGLPNGQVLVAGGRDTNYLMMASAELYDTALGTWTQTAALSTARYGHTATLLTSGKVLVAGGWGGAYTYLSGSELYDVGSGFSAAWRPQIASVTSPLALGSSLALAGSGFRGISTASSGGMQDSPTAYPLVQLRSLESGQTMFLLPTNWQTNFFASAPVWPFAPGYALATVFVNGIPSTGAVVNLSVPVPAATTLTDARRLTNGALQFAFTNTAGALFGVLAATNPTLPLTNWTALGGVTEVSPGQFQFTDPQTANTPRRFYRVRAP
jgi:hypothetical protein